MAYATQAQIQSAAGGESELKQLADWDGDGSIDSDAIEYAQAAADGYFNSKFSLRYTVPVDLTAIAADQRDVVVRMAAHQAVIELRRARNLLTAEHQLTIDWINAWLTEVQDGRTRLADPAPAKSDAVRSQTVVNNRDVSRENLKGYT